MQPDDIRPIYVPYLDPDLFPMDWRDQGHWLVVKGFRPIACYHGSYFAAPREVFDDFSNRYTLDMCEIGDDADDHPTAPWPEWGEGCGCGFAIFRDGQPRAAWVEVVGDVPANTDNFHEFPGWGCVTITGKLSGSIDGLHPLPAGWPDRLDLIRDGRILLPDPMAIPPRAMDLFKKFGEICEAKSKQDPKPHKSRAARSTR